MIFDTTRVSHNQAELILSATPTIEKEPASYLKPIHLHLLVFSKKSCQLEQVVQFGSFFTPDGVLITESIILYHNC